MVIHLKMKKINEDLTVTIKLSDDEFTRTQSSKIIESTANSTSISIVEDNAGDILLDLKDFNIDPWIS